MVAQRRYHGKPHGFSAECEVDDTAETTWRTLLTLMNIRVEACDVMWYLAGSVER